MDSTLVKLFEQAGFSPKEAQVYLALLELGKGTANEIAKNSGLKRPIVYVLLEVLEQRGYVSPVPGIRTLTYKPADPTLISLKLNTTAKHFSEMLPFLKTMSSRGKKRPKITYYENLEGIFQIYESMNHVKDSFFITSYSRLNALFPRAMETWIRNQRKGIYPLKGRHLVPNIPEDIAYGKELAKLDQQIRISDEFKNTQMDFTIFGNKLSISSLGEQPFCVVIESEEVVESMKPLFEMAWRNAKPIRNNEKNTNLQKI